MSRASACTRSTKTGYLPRMISIRGKWIQLTTVWLIVDAAKSKSSCRDREVLHQRYTLSAE